MAWAKRILGLILLGGAAYAAYRILAAPQAGAQPPPQQPQPRRPGQQPRRTPSPPQQPRSSPQPQPPAKGPEWCRVAMHAVAVTRYFSVSGDRVPTWSWRVDSVEPSGSSGFSYSASPDWVVAGTGSSKYDSPSPDFIDALRIVYPGGGEEWLFFRSPWCDPSSFQCDARIDSLVLNVPRGSSIYHYLEFNSASGGRVASTEEVLVNTCTQG